MRRIHQVVYLKK